MKKSARPPQNPIPVKVEYNGTTHTAEYTIESGVVIVRYGAARNQAIPSHGSLHGREAQRLLREILVADKWRF